MRILVTALLSPCLLPCLPGQADAQVKIGYTNIELGIQMQDGALCN